MFEFGTILFDSTNGHETRFIRSDGQNCAVLDNEIDAIIVRHESLLFTELAWEEHCEQKADDWSIATNEMNQIVSEALVREYGEDVRDIVIYSAYPTGEDDLPINNLDQVAFKGTYRVDVPGDSFFGNGNAYCHPHTMVDPTWLDLALAANMAILATGDEHHVFFEGATVTCEPTDSKPGRIELYFGS